MLPVLVLGVVLLVVLLLVYVKQEGTGIPPGPDRFRRADRGADPEARRNGAAAPERSGPGRPGPGESGAEGGEDPFSAVVPPLLPEDEGDRGAGEGDGPVRPEAGEAGATGPETGDAGPAAVAPASTAQIAIRRRQFVGEVLDACEIHDFPAADGICERSIEDPVLAELALPTRRAVAVVMAVVAEARRTIAGWAGTERTLHLRSGGTSSRRIMEVRDDRVMVALDVEGMEGGGISIGFDALGARTILEAGKVPAGLPTALVRLLLYRDAPGAAGALEDADARVREPYDGLLLFLEFDASLARADEAYAEERWRRALDAYLDLRARYPEPELFGADTGRIEQRLRNCLLLSRVAGRFHVDVETEGGALVFRYRLDEPRELADWTGGAAWLDDEARTATWTGRLEGDVSIEMDVEPRAGDLWMQFHGGDGGRDGYVFRLAQGNWRLAKMVDGVEATPMASTGATVTDRAYPVRVERTGGAIRVHVDGRPAPALRLEDDAYHGGELRVGGEPRALRQIRIAGRPPVDFPD